MAGAASRSWRGSLPDNPGIARIGRGRSSRTTSRPTSRSTQSINPYRGCEHGCVYCYARPSHGHLGLSAGLDFETKIFVKHEAAQLLRQELARPGYVCRPISLGANTDPYQPLERRLRITRQVLEVLAAVRHPVGIVTKSALVTRDIDLLAPMAREGLARVYVSVTTLDPRSPAPWSRAPRTPPTAGSDPSPGGSRGRNRRHGGADHPGADRPRDRADPGSRSRSGSGQRRFRAVCACPTRSRT